METRAVVARSGANPPLGRGIVHLRSSVARAPPRPLNGITLFGTEMHAMRRRLLLALMVGHTWFLGIPVVWYLTAGPYYVECIAVTYLIVFAVGAVLASRHANRRRRMAGCCECGYDLRASPKRCPECGRWTRSRKPWFVS
jgi:hypothetical protein